MKKIISLIIVMMMVLSMVVVLPVSAVEAEGNWEVHLDHNEEIQIEEGKGSYIPLPGYEYTEDGFEVIPPVYSNVQAKYTVISKTKYSTKNFSIKIRLDEYDASGDNWLSFSFWSEKHGLVQGDTNAYGKYGYGWNCLVRDYDSSNYLDTRDNLLSHFEGFDSGTKDAPGGWNARGEFDFEPVIGDDGLQYIEFKVVNNIVYVNGVAADTTTCKALYNAFKGDSYLAYFGISVKSGLSSTPIKFTILEVDGAKPTGSDRAEPEVKTREFAPIMDESNVPAGTPGVLFDASFTAQNSKMPSESQCIIDFTENDTFNVKVLNTMGSIGFEVRDDYSVDINDFPYIVVVLKNFCTCEETEGYTMRENCSYGEKAGFFYSAGKTLAADNDHRCPLNSLNMYDVTPEGSEDYYTIFVSKATAADLLEGPARIHALRFDYAFAIPSMEFEIIAAGYFRSNADIAAFVTSKGLELTAQDLGDPEPGEEDTGDNNENGGSEEPTTKFEAATAPLEEEEKKSEKTTTEKVEGNVSDEKKGCGSVVGMGAISVVALASAMSVITFKKRRKNRF